MRPLRPSEENVLSLIKAAHPQHGVEPVDLVHATNLSPAAVYTALRELRRRGLVKRHTFAALANGRPGHGQHGGATYYKVA